jgi:hypothetical protein
MLFQILLNASPLDKPGILTSGSVMYVFPPAKLIGRAALPSQSGHSIAGGEQTFVSYLQTCAQGPLYWQLNEPCGGLGIQPLSKEYQLQSKGAEQLNAWACAGTVRVQ